MINRLRRPSTLFGFVVFMTMGVVLPQLPAAAAVRFGPATTSSSTRNEVGTARTRPEGRPTPARCGG